MKNVRKQIEARIVGHQEEAKKWHELQLEADFKDKHYYASGASSCKALANELEWVLETMDEYLEPLM